MKIDINAEMVKVGDTVVHPLDLRPRKVESIQRSFGSQDYLDFGFEGVPFMSIWRTTRLTVIR